MKPSVSVLRSFNEQVSKAFYLDFLGFEVIFEHRHDPGLPLYMGIKQGDCEVHLTEHFGDAAPGAAVRIEVPDVQSYAEALNAKNYKHARPGVNSMPWGAMEMVIMDPNGNRLTFFSPTPET
ncbi:MAG: glyoxalase superfamily protein [Pseudomonadota bacterium]